jgi:hypothetical protein
MTDLGCPICRMEKGLHKMDCQNASYVSILTDRKKADYIAFAQWFRSGANRYGRTAEECYDFWSAMDEK